MKLVRYPVYLLGAMVMLGIIASPALAAEEEAHVLILNGYDPYLPANLMMDSGMRANLANESARRIVLYSESLDAGRFAVESREAELVALFTKKYGARRIDVVVAVTKPALDFFRRNGEQLWPGARLVFHGIPDPAEEAVSIPPGAVGIVNRDDVGGTIDIARRLQPTARRILVIVGVGAGDLQVERRVRRLAPTVAGTATMEFISGLPLPELLARVASEPTDTIILYLTQFLDRDGRDYRPPDVAQVMSSVSTAPVYGLYETYIGRGVAAGSMASYEDRGRLVGQLVRETLAGTRYAPGSSVFTVASRCVADARALQRWSLDAQRLPAGCDVRFADRSLWREYLWQIATGLAIIVAQALLIAALLIQRRQRRVAEVEVQHQRIELAHASRLAALGELSASIAHEVNQPLGAIASNADAVELLLDAEPPKLEDARRVLLDLKTANQRASDVVLRIRELLRTRKLAFELYDLNAAAAEIVRLLDTDAKARGVQVVADFGSLPVVRGDRLQIQQVLLNLLINGMDAMVGTPAGQRHLNLRTVHREDGDVEIVVADSGSGIDAADISRLFDSFFTTKEKGMGLGLALCRSIVQAHRGRIWAENSSGGGATFRIVLPVDAEHRVPRAIQP